jgi:hypothetical protein
MKIKVKKVVYCSKIIIIDFVVRDSPLPKSGLKAQRLFNMAKKDFFLIVDTETTMSDMVADFGAVVCDRNGKVYTSCSVLIHGIYNDRKNHELFHDKKLVDSSLWAKNNLESRYTKYDGMLESGRRMVATNVAINRWLDKVKEKYNPYLTAYNLAFDAGKCENTDIDLAQFTKRFCLWYAAFDKYATTKRYRQFILDHHLFKNPTKLGNMSYITNAEVMTRYVTNQPFLVDEPHTAIEDVLGYELPILVDIVKKSKKERWLNPRPFDWRKLQVKDWFIPK